MWLRNILEDVIQLVTQMGIILQDPNKDLSLYRGLKLIITAAEKSYGEPCEVLNLVNLIVALDKLEPNRLTFLNIEFVHAGAFFRLLIIK